MLRAPACEPCTIGAPALQSNIAPMRGALQMATRARRRLLSGTSAPSEMSLETNVLRYLANCLERSRGGLAEGAVEMASPTQNEEAHMGYDSQVKLPDGRYVLLQFKRPLPGRTSISFKVPSGQVAALLGPYAHSSFFALPAVRTNDDMWGARGALLDCTIIVDAWDLCASFAASMPEGLDWIYGSKPVVRTVRVNPGDAAGRAVSVSQGRGRKAFTGISPLPISRLCDAGRYGFAVRGGTGRYGFAVRGGAVLAPDGTILDRKKYREAVEARRWEYWDLYLSKGGRDGPRTRDLHTSNRPAARTLRGVRTGKSCALPAAAAAAAAATRSESATHDCPTPPPSPCPAVVLPAAEPWAASRTAAPPRRISASDRAPGRLRHTMPGIARPARAPSFCHRGAWVAAAAVSRCTCSRALPRRHSGSGSALRPSRRRRRPGGSAKAAEAAARPAQKRPANPPSFPAPEARAARAPPHRPRRSAIAAARHVGERGRRAGPPRAKTTPETGTVIPMLVFLLRHLRLDRPVCGPCTA